MWRSNARCNTDLGVYCPIKFVGFKKVVYRLIYMFLLTDFFGKRRKIYAWMKRNDSNIYIYYADPYPIPNIDGVTIQPNDYCILSSINQYKIKLTILYHLET